MYKEIETQQQQKRRELLFMEVPGEKDVICMSVRDIDLECFYYFLIIGLNTVF